MAATSFYFACGYFLIIGSTICAASAEKENNAIALLFGSETLLDELRLEMSGVEQEIEEVRVQIVESYQSLYNQIISRKKQEREILAKLKAQNLLLNKILNELNKQTKSIPEEVGKQDKNEKSSNDVSLTAEHGTHAPCKLYAKSSKVMEGVESEKNIESKEYNLENKSDPVVTGTLNADVIVVL